MSKLKHKVLEDIKEKNITPTSKFYFVSKTYFFWLLFVSSIIIGAIAFSTILFQLVIETNVWKDLATFHRPSLFVEAVPLFWLALVSLFTISAWYNFKNIPGTHRTENAIIVLASILFSLLFGLLLFKVGTAEKLEYIMRENFSTYRQAVERNMERKAEFLMQRDISPREIMLKREELRTLCLNQGRDDCFVSIDDLTDEQVISATTTKEVKEIGVIEGNN